jgi:hypothetical protein
MVNVTVLAVQQITPLAENAGIMNEAANALGIQYLNCKGQLSAVVLA